jgi:endonuclease/exonuclease/phosphatase family metal-dependent hydrolase
MSVGPTHVLQLNVARSSHRVHALLTAEVYDNFDILLIQDPWWGPIGHAKSVSDPDARIYGTTASRGWNCLLPPNIGPTKAPGVVIYYRIGQKGITAALATDFPHTTDCLAADFTINGSTLRIINVYLHGEGHAANLNNLLDYPLAQDIPIVIAGDFNLQHELWSLTTATHKVQSAGASDLAEWIISNDLDILNNPDTPTRRGRTGQKDSIIDLTIINPVARELDWTKDWECSQKQALGSDHNCITWTLTPFENPHYSHPKPTYRYDIDESRREKWDIAFKTAIEANPTPTAYTATDDVEKGAKAVLEAMGTATHKSMKRVRCNNAPPRAMWWDERCSQAVTDINECTKGGEELEQRRGALRSAIRAAKRKHAATICTETPTKEIYNLTKWYQGRRNSKIPPIQYEGRLTSDPREQAEAFKKAFFPTEPPKVDCTDPMGIPAQTRREHHPITEAEIKAALDDSSNTSAPGAFGSNYRVLKWAFQENPERIVDLYNACLNFEYHPLCLRNAVVTIIPKPNKPNMSSPRAYRPISLLETLSKCLEKVITARLLYEVGKYNLIPFTQFGGRNCASCVDAGLALTHDIQTAWSKDQRASLLTMDIKGYFDNVNHDRLIYTMTRLGFSSPTCAWLRSYLSSRSIQICIDNTLYDKLHLQPVGIPQGSPLSPVLSSIYSLPLLYLFPQDLNVSIRAYVDDFSILATSGSFNFNREEIQDAANTANECLRKLGLEFELEKSELIHFARNRKELDVNPNMILERPDGGAHTIRAANIIRWLGFFLDRRVSFKDHIRKMAIKGLSVIAGLKMLANTVRGLKVEHARILYKGCVVPILTYGSPIWYREHGCKTLIKPLEKAQNAGLRWLLGAFRTSPVHAMEHVASICKTCFSLGGLPETAETAEDFESLREVSERPHSHHLK